MNDNESLEILDLVNVNDEVVGTMERERIYQKGLSNLRDEEGVSFRVIDAFIKNTEGELFIPRRHPDKRLFPLRLDVSVGGHVTSGDSYEVTLKKEAKEELNIDISNFTYKILGKMSPFTNGVSAFTMVYEIESDETPNYNLEDFIEHFWLTPEELIARIEGEDLGKGNLPKIVKKFYLSN